MSKSRSTSIGMGLAVTLVLTLTGMANWAMYHLFLVPTGSEIMSFLVFIVVIACVVQVLELAVAKFFPALQNSFGIFLPLITVNCAVLAVSLFMVLRTYTFWQTTFFAFGSGLGWFLAIAIISGIREKMHMVSDVPQGLRGAGITFVIAGILSLAFMGFSGMVNVQ